MKKKRLFKSLVLLFSSSLALGTFLSLQLADVKDKAIAAYAYEGTKLPSSGGTLSSGTYYLDEDTTLTNYITAATGNNIIINLNGFSLSAKPNSSQPIVYVHGGTLTINGKDDVSGTMGTLCNGTGYYDGSYTRGGAIAVYADGTSMGNATINDCIIANNEANFAGAVFVSKGTTATLNNCNVHDNDSTSYAEWGLRGAIYVEGVGATVNINGGEIYNNEGGVLLWGEKTKSSYGNLNGVYVHDNARFGVRVNGSDNGAAPLTIAGDTIIESNAITETSTVPLNLRLNGSNDAKFTFSSGLGENASIGITMTGTNGVFTSGWSQYMGDADFSDYFFSDKTDVMIGKNPSGELLIGAPRTVTYNTEHGTAPDSDTVADGSIIYNEPTSPSEEGYVFQGWYKDSGFENAWDFETDTVTADTTLYAKWESDSAVATVTSGETVTEYSNFSDAVSAWKSASNGATLTLLNDVTISSPIVINDESSKTFDLNGYGINASGIPSNTDYAILVNDGGSLTLNDSGDTTHYFTHERYKGYDAGLATICDKATYDAASEDSRGTFEGGYLTGLSIVKGDVSQSGFFKIEENSSVTMNGGTIIGIYADYSSSCVCSNGTFIMNDGNMIYNVNARGCINARSGILTINGGNISHNTDKSSKNSGRTGALWLNNIDNPTYTIRGGTITNNVAINGAINTQSDIAIEGNPVIKDNVGVGTDENSDAPMNIVLSLGIESKLNFVGEYTGSEPLGVSVYMNDVIDVTNSADVSFNNINNVVSDNPNYAIRMYPSNHAKAGQLFYAKLETLDVIDAIDNIGSLTYDGGANDSLDDIIAAKAAYDALTPEQKAVVNKVNKDVLDQDILTYNDVDKVGDLIAAIPAPSASDEYYDAITLAKTEYDKLTPEEGEILNSVIDFEQILNDHIAAKEVIELINDIGDDITHGGEGDSKEAIQAARRAYDNLTDDQKALVDSSEDSSQDIENAERVYEAMEAIDAIGEVGYDNASEEAIQKAREIVDSLTDEQKEMLTQKYIDTLVAAETQSNSLRRSGDLLFWILFIIVLLTLISGLFFLFFLIKKKREKDNDNNGNGPKEVKAMSVGGFLPAVTLISHYLDTKYIILYVLAGVAVLVWVACLVIAIYKKKNKAAKAQKEGASLAESEVKEQPVMVEESANGEEEETVTVTDEKGNIFQIRFIKSFTAKLIQSPEETKKYYEELKNEVLSYKKTNSRVSWHYDSINSGRNQVIKFVVRGKTLCVYFPLNADEYEDSKYKVEKVESKKYEDVPCLYRIKNDRRLGYAKELIEVVADKLGLEKGEEQHEVYSNLPYEENKPLVARGLIKELKVQVNKPADAPVVLESKVNAEGDEVVLTKDNSGNIFEIRYIKSFTAKLSQSEDEVKDYYTILKNYVLSYKGVHSRVSWHYDAFNVGRDYVLKFAIRGKTLCVYYALDASKLEDKYKVEEAKGRKFEDVPVLYRIKNDRRCEYAKELIDLLMKEHGLDQGDVPNDDYHIKKESTKALLAKGLIKEVKSKVQDKKAIEHYESITVSKADEVMSDEKAEASLEEVEESKRREGSKEIVNIDTLSNNYKNGDEVTLESLIKKKLVSSKAGYVKILARGELNKKLHVVANDYSLQAIKMIVLMGGTTKKIK